MSDAHALNPPRRLLLFKESMWEVTNTLKQQTPPEAKTTEDMLSWTMIFIRAAETINISRMERAAAAYPHLATIIPIGDPNTRIHKKIIEVKQHAAELAHKQLTDDLLHLTHSSDDPTSEPYLRKKQQLITKLARLVPGATHSIGAIQTDEEVLATTPKDIAEALKNIGSAYSEANQ